MRACYDGGERQQYGWYVCVSPARYYEGEFKLKIYYRDPGRALLSTPRGWSTILRAPFFARDIVFWCKPVVDRESRFTTRFSGSGTNRYLLLLAYIDYFIKGIFGGPHVCVYIRRTVHGYRLPVFGDGTLLSVGNYCQNKRKFGETRISHPVYSYYYLLRFFVFFFGPPLSSTPPLTAIHFFRLQVKYYTGANNGPWTNSRARVIPLFINNTIRYSIVDIRAISIWMYDVNTLRYRTIFIRSFQIRTISP